VGILSSCASNPFPEAEYNVKEAKFPAENVQTGEHSRPYKALGWIRVKSTFPTMATPAEVQRRCVNEFNRAAKKLLERAQKRKADAVIRVQSVVFVLTGETEKFPRPECTDDGEIADITVEGLAVNWKPDPVVPKNPAADSKKLRKRSKKSQKVMSKEMI
jgi:hypothetical protein